MEPTLNEGKIHTAIAKDLSKLGGLLRCNTCEFEQPLGNVGEKLSMGWPKHCGYTMTWVTARELAPLPESKVGED